MKLKLMPSKRVLTVAGVVALIVVALMVSNSRSEPKQGPLDSAASRSCDAFAVGYPKAADKPARLALADRVMMGGRTDNDVIAERQAEMGRSASDGNPRWKASAEALLSACREAGWTAVAKAGG